MSDSIWEPLEHLSNAQDLITDYYCLHNYNLPRCSHDNIDTFQLPWASPSLYHANLDQLCKCYTDTQFRQTQKETGLCKQSIFLGLDQRYSSGLPGCLAINHMHIIAIIPDLLISLWHGTIDCDNNDSKGLWDWVVLIGDTWKSHGQDVARCHPYLPGSFNCPPRNPAEKISSGYKAWEFLIYLFSLCPALLYNVLPWLYWLNFCKLVSAVQLLQQHAISASQVEDAHRLVLDFTEEYKAIYYH